MDQATAAALTTAFLHGASAGAAFATVVCLAYGIWRSRRER